MLEARGLQKSWLFMRKKRPSSAILEGKRVRRLARKKRKGRKTPENVECRLHGRAVWQERGHADTIKEKKEKKQVTMAERNRKGKAGKSGKEKKK